MLVEMHDRASLKKDKRDKMFLHPLYLSGFKKRAADFEQIAILNCLSLLLF